MQSFIRFVTENFLKSDNMHFAFGGHAHAWTLPYAAQKLAPTRRHRHHFKLGEAVRASSCVVRFFLPSAKSRK